MRTEIVTCDRCRHVFQDGENVNYRRFTRVVEKSQSTCDEVVISELCDKCAVAVDKIFDGLNKRGRKKKSGKAPDNTD